MLGKMFLVVIDAHRKWLEVIPMGVCSVYTTVQALHTLFAQFGILEAIVADNGPQFMASEFQDFCKANGIQQVRVALYHPSLNGLEERAVRIFKDGLKKKSTGSLTDWIARLLFEYRWTPHTTIGVSPVELMFGCQLRSCLSLVGPALQQKVFEKQAQQKSAHDRLAKHQEFCEGEELLITMHKQDVWRPGKVVVSLGPLSWQVELSDGRLRRCDVDQMWKKLSSELVTVKTQEDSEAVVPMPTPAKSPSPGQLRPASGGTGLSKLDRGERHYPMRERRPPDRFS